MSDLWFSFDVREEVIKDVKRFCAERGLSLPDDLMLERISTSILMDLSFLESFMDSETAECLRGFFEERFFHYRGKKYGTQSYWIAARKEREIGYSGRWFDFLGSLLEKYVHHGDKVLFVGTANGAEIPNDTQYQYYALEQLTTSARQIRISHVNVAGVINGSFEDETLIVDEPHSMSCIAALRCLTPNCRLDRFSTFMRNNLSDQGVLILSYPTAYLDETDNLVPLHDVEEQLRLFEQALHDEIVEKRGFQIDSCLRSRVERIYILSIPDRKATESLCDSRV